MFVYHIEVVKNYDRLCSKYHAMFKLSRSDPGYQFVYFNEMNLAVKSPVLTRKAISADVLRLLTEVLVQCHVL